jgi:hypothetical protein
MVPGATEVAGEVRWPAGGYFSERCVPADYATAEGAHGALEDAQAASSMTRQSVAKVCRPTRLLGAIPGSVRDRRAPRGTPVRSRTRTKDGQSGDQGTRAAVADPCEMCNIDALAPVAQLDRAADFESVGRVFDSPRAR